MKDQERFAQPHKMFVVAILCKYGRGRHGNTYYGRWMASGINEDRRGRFQHTTERTRAAKFAKLTAESLVETLRKNYRLIARVEPEVQ